MSGRRRSEGARVGAPVAVEVDGEALERHLIDDDGDGAADRAVGYAYAGGPRPARILFYDDGADDQTPDHIQHIGYSAGGKWASFGEDEDGDGKLERRSTYMFKGGKEVERLWESDSDGDGRLDTFRTFDVALNRVTAWMRKLDDGGDGDWDWAEMRFLDAKGHVVRTEFHSWDDANDAMGPAERIEHIGWDSAGNRWAAWTVDEDGDGDPDHRSTYMFEDGEEVARLWESDSDGDGRLDTTRTFDVALDRVVSQRRNVDSDGDGAWDRVEVRTRDAQGRVVRTEFHDWDGSAAELGPPERIEHVTWNPATGLWTTAALDHDGDGNVDKHTTFFLSDPPATVRPFSYMKRWKLDTDDDGTFDVSRLVDPARGDRVIGESFDPDPATGAFTRQERYTFDESGLKLLIEFDADHDDVYDAAEARIFENGIRTEARLYDDHDGSSDYDALLAGGTPGRVYRYGLGLDDDGSGDDARYDTLDDAGRAVESLFDLDADGVDRAEAYSLDAAGRRTEIRFYDSHAGTFDLAGLSPDRIHRLGYDAADLSDLRWLTLSKDADADGNAERSVTRAFHPGGGEASLLAVLDDGSGGGTADDGTADRRILETFDAVGALLSTRHDDDADGVWDRTVDGEGSRRLRFDGEGRVTLAEFDENGDGVFTRAEAYRYGAGDLKTVTVYYDDGWLLDAGGAARPLEEQTPDRELTVADADGDGTGESRRHDEYADDGETVTASLFDTDNDPNGRWERAEAYERRDGVVVLAKLGTAAGADPKAAAPVYDAAEAHIHEDGVKIQTRLYDRYDGASGFDAVTAETPERIYHYRLELDADGSDDARYDTLDAAGRTVASLFDTDADGPDRAEAYVLDSGGRRTEIRFYDSHAGTFDLAGLSPDRIHRYAYDVGDSSDPDWLSQFRDDNGDGNFERSVVRAFHPGGGVATRLTSFDDGDGDGAAEDGSFDRKTLETFDAAGALLSTKHDDDHDGRWDRIEDGAGSRRYRYDAEGRTVLTEYDGDGDGAYTRAEAWTWDGAAKTRIDFHDEGGWDDAPGAANTPDRVYRYGLELDADGSDDARYDTLDAAGRIAESLFDTDADGVDRAEAYSLDAAGRRTEIRFHDSHTGTFDLAALTPDRTHRFGWNADDATDTDWLSFSEDGNGDGNFERSVVRAFHPGGGVATRLSSFDDGSGAGTAEDGIFDRRTLETFDESGALLSTKRDDDNDGSWDRIDRAGSFTSPDGSRTADTRRETLDGEGRVQTAVHEDEDGSWGEERSYGADGKILRTDFYDPWPGAGDATAVPERSEHFGRDRDGDGTADIRRDTLDDEGRVVVSVFEDGAGGGARAETYIYGTTDADRDQVVRTVHYDDWTVGDALEDQTASRTMDFFYDNGPMYASRYRRIGADGVAVEKGWDIDNDGVWDWVESYRFDAVGRIVGADYDTDGDGAVERSESRSYDAKGRIVEARHDLDDNGYADLTLVHTWTDGAISETAFRQREGIRKHSWTEWTEAYTRDDMDRVVRVDYHDDGDASGTPDRAELYTLDDDGLIVRALFHDDGDASGMPDAEASYQWNVPAVRTVFDSASGALPHRWIELRLRDGTFLGTLSDPRDDGVDDTVDFSGSQVGFGDNPQTLYYDFYRREGRHSSGTYDFLPRRINEPSDLAERRPLTDPHGITVVGPPTDWLLRGPMGDDTIVFTRAVGDATADLQIDYGGDEYVFPPGGTGSTVHINSFGRPHDRILIDDNIDFDDLDLHVGTFRYGDSTVVVGIPGISFFLREPDFAFSDTDVISADADSDGTPEARTVRRYRGELTASEMIELDFDDDDAIDRRVWRTFDPDGRLAATLTDRDNDGAWDAAVSLLLGSGPDVRLTRFADALDGGRLPASWDRVERHAFRGGQLLLTEFDDDGDGGFERAEAYEYDGEGRVVRVDFHDEWDDAVRDPGRAPERIHRWDGFGAGVRTRREDNDADGAADVIYHVTVDDAGRPARAEVDLDADGTADRAERYHYFGWDSPFEGELQRIDFHDNGSADASADRYRRYGDDGDGGLVLVEKGFDADGDGLIDWKETYTAFDAEGRPAAVAYDVDGDGDVDRVDRIRYDSAGRTDEIRRDSDADGAVDRILVHTWTFGRISETAVHRGGVRKRAPDWVEAYTRDAEGRVVRVDYHDDGDAAGAPDRVEEYTLDADGLIVRALFHDDGDAASAADGTQDYEWNDPSAGADPSVVVDPLDAGLRPHRWIVLRGGGAALGKMAEPRFDGADDAADFRGGTGPVAVPADAVPRLLNQAEPEPLTVYAPRSFTELRGSGLDEAFVLPADRLDGGGDAPVLAGGGGADEFLLDPAVQAADGLRILDFAPGDDRLRYAGAADKDGDGDTDFDDLRAAWSGAGTPVSAGGFTEHPDTRIELAAAGGELSVVLEGVAWRSQRVGGELVVSSELGPDDVVFPGGARTPAGPRRYGFDERHRVALAEFDDNGDGTFTRAEAYGYGAVNLAVETTYWDDWDQDAARSAQVRDRTLTVTDADGNGTGESRRHDRYDAAGLLVVESLFDTDNAVDGGWERAEGYERDGAGRVVLVKTDPTVVGTDPANATVDYAGGRAEIRILDGDGATTELRFFDAYDGSSNFAALSAAVADRIHRFGLELDDDGNADDARHDRLDGRGRAALSLFDHGADGTFERAEAYERLGASDDRLRVIRFGAAAGDDPETATGDWSRGERYAWDGDAERKTLIEFDDSGDGIFTRAEAYEYGVGGLKTKTFWYDGWAVGRDGAALPRSEQTVDRMLHNQDREPDGAADSRLHVVYDDAGRTVERLEDADNDGSWDGAMGFEYDADGAAVLEKSGDSIAGADPATAVIDWDSAEIRLADPAETWFFDDYDGTSDFAALAAGTPDRAYRYRKDLDGDGSADDARYDKLDDAGRIVESLLDLDNSATAPRADRAEAHSHDAAGRRTETRFHDSWTGTFDLSGQTPDRIHRWTYDASDTADGRWRTFTEDADGDGSVDARQVKTYGAGGTWESLRVDLDDDGTWDRTETNTWHAGGGLKTRRTAFDDGRLGGTADDGTTDIWRLETFDAAGALASVKFDHDDDGTWDETRTHTYQAGGALGTIRIERDDGAGGGTADDGAVDSVVIESYGADGRVSSVQHDYNNNGTWDRSDVINRHANGEIAVRLASFDDGAGGGIADDGAADRTQLHVHDAAGRETSVHYDDNADGRVDRARRHAYDPAGRLLSTKSDDDNDGTWEETTIWVRRADGGIRMELTTWDDGSAGGTADDGTFDATRLRIFDAEGRLTRADFDDDGDGAEDRAVEYEYGAGDLKVRTAWRGDWTDLDGGSPEGVPPLSRTLTVADADGDGTGESSREDFYDAAGAHVVRALFDDELDGTADRAELHERDAGGRATRTAFHDEWEGTAGETPDRVHVWTYHQDGPENPQWATWSKNDNAGEGNTHFEYAARVHKWHGTDEDTRLRSVVRIQLDDGHGDGDPDDGTVDRHREDRYGTDGKLDAVSYDNNGDGTFEYLEQFIGEETHTFFDTLVRRVKVLTDADGDGVLDTVSQHTYASDDPDDGLLLISRRIRTEIHEDWDGTSDVAARPPDRIHHTHRDFDGDGASDDRRFDRLENGETVELLFDFDTNRTVERAERHAWSVHGGASRKDRSEFFDAYDAVYSVGGDPADLDAALTADRVVEYLYDNGSGDVVPNRYRNLGTADAAGARAVVERGFDTDGDGTIDWVERYTAFDTKGRPTRVVYDTEGHGLRIDEYSYDNAGRIVEVRRDLDGDGAVDRIAARAWDTAGERIASIAHHDGAAKKATPDRIEVRTYDGNGRLARTDHHDDGVTGDAPDRVELYKTNGDGLIVRADFYDDGRLDADRDGATDEADHTAVYVWNDPAERGANPLTIFDSADDAARPERWVLLQAGGTTVGRLSDLRFDGGRDLVDFRGPDAGVDISDAVVPRTLDEANAAGRTVWFPSTAKANLTASDAGDVFILSGPVADPNDRRTATGGAGADAFILHDTSGTINIHDFDPAGGDRLLTSVSERFFFGTFTYGFLGKGISNFGGTSAPPAYPELEGGGLVLFHDTPPATFGDWEPVGDREESDYQDLSDPGDAGLGFNNPDYYDRIYAFALVPGAFAFDFEL